jgi:hypothetical protein
MGMLTPKVNFVYGLVPAGQGILRLRLNFQPNRRAASSWRQFWAIAARADKANPHVIHIF